MTSALVAADAQHAAMKPEGGGDPAPVAQLPARRWSQGHSTRSLDPVLGEYPVALCYNGISHAVMMCTPSDLEDFALGFSLTEAIIERADQLYGVEIVPRDTGIELSLEIAGQAFARLKQRRRQLAGRSGCGLCGVESLEQLAPGGLQPVSSALRVTHTAIQRALAQLPARQALQAQTGAAHAAAWCSASGELRYLREDVGRHNALDKLLGAYSRVQEPGDGFVVVTSRASYELVAKTARMGIPLLVAVSAPTTMAVECANDANLTLVGFARAGRHEVYSAQQRVE